MGEAKKKRDKMTPVERIASEITHKLINDGRIVEGGFAAFCILNDIEATDQLREAWFASADHLLRSIISSLDPEKDPTPKDYERMDKIDSELMKWREVATLRYATPEGTA